MFRKGPRPLIIFGPSGSGKSTLLKKLFDEYPNTFGFRYAKVSIGLDLKSRPSNIFHSKLCRLLYFSVSHTTRKPRAGEENGVHYHFVEREAMKAAIKMGEFLENAEFGGNLYGTR